MAQRTLILGIESSCDETSAAVVADGHQVRANIVASQHDLHEKFGGVVPEIASRAHIECLWPILDEALETAGVRLDRIDAVAVGNRPGLIGSLLVGVSAAKTLAWALGKPLIGLDHVHAHLYAPALDASPIAYPALGLAVSGGHTALYRIADPLNMHRLGRTIDDAVGEAYDKVAAMLDLGWPGGPRVDQLAQRGRADTVAFPRSLLDAESLDFSFSGLKTAVLYHVRGKPVGRGRDVRFQREAAALSETDKADICAAFQQAVIDVLTIKIQRALDRLTAEGTAVRSLIIGGGVSANSLLRQRTSELAEQYGLDVRLPAMAYCLDNAAMIAGLAYDRFVHRRFDDMDLQAVATSRL